MDIFWSMRYGLFGEKIFTWGLHVGKFYPCSNYTEDVIEKLVDFLFWRRKYFRSPFFVFKICFFIFHAIVYSFVSLYLFKHMKGCDYLIVYLD